MGELIAVGVVAGFLAAISPCILPVLPVILVAGARPGDLESGRARRPVLVVLGLVLSFSLLVLAGSELLSLLHLPPDTLRDTGLALLALVGLGYLIPPLGALLERPFARLGARRPSGRGSGFVLGLALGLVYVPCAGPILAAITVAGATHRVGLGAVILTAAFAVGTSVPLLGFALASGEVTGRLRALRRHAAAVRMAGGAVLVVVAVLIGFNVLAGLQRDVPGYSTALQGSAAVRRLQYLDPAGSEVRDAAAAYHFPATLPLGAMAWSGTWTDHTQEVTAGERARLELSFLAHHVYLVLGGHGRITVNVNGRLVKTIDISGVPRLYTLYQAGSAQPGKLLLSAPPGVQAYDFTFG